MPAGRPRQPDEIKILNGTWRADRDGDPTTAVVADGEPTPPRYLKKEALAFWREIVPPLVANGIAKACDSAQLAIMCEWFARYCRLSRRLDRMRDNAKALYQTTVLCGICWTNFDKLASRFGLTPSDRSKLRIVQKRSEPLDPAEEFLRGKTG